MIEGDLVYIDFTNTIMEGNDFISPIGIIQRVLNDATHNTTYLVNDYWWGACNLELAY